MAPPIEAQASVVSNSSPAESSAVGLIRPKTPWLWHIVHFSPFLLLVWFTARFGVNVPIYDDWWLVDWFYAVHRKTATFADLFALNNEHRIVFPKLIWTLLAFASHWNQWLAMAVNLFAGLLIFAIFYWISSRHRERSGSTLANPANFATSLLVFCVMQYENWLWEFGLAFLLAQAAVALAIAVCLVEQMRPSMRLALAAFFCFVASFTAAQGLFSWLALLPCIARIKTGSGRAGKFYIWFLLFAATTALYSYHFKFAIWTGDTARDVLAHPLESVRFFFALLGAPFCQASTTFVACVTGGVILICLLSCLLVSCLPATRGWEQKDELAPWIAVAAFGLLFTTMVTIARSNFGLGVALAQSRYITGTIWVPIATLQLGRAVCEHKRQQLYLLGVGALCSLTMLSSMHSVLQARQLKEERSRSKLFLNIVRYIDPATDSSRASLLFPLFAMEGHTGYIRGPAELLNEMGFLHLASDVTFVEHPTGNYGLFETAQGSEPMLQLRPKDQVTVSGWAISGNPGSANLVLISCGEQKSFIAGAVVGVASRRDIAMSGRSPTMMRSGWSALFPAEFLPAGEGTLKAWLYDSAQERFVLLPETGGDKRFNLGRGGRNTTPLPAASSRNGFPNNREGGRSCR